MFMDMGAEYSHILRLLIYGMIGGADIILIYGVAI
jgi:hypothetical protein